MTRVHLYPRRPVSLQVFVNRRKSGRAHMKIDRAKNKEGGWEWKVDVTIAGARVRESGFATKRKLEEFVDDLRLRAREQRYGLRSPAAGIRIADLVAAHTKTLRRRGDRNDLRGVKVLAEFAAQLPADMLVQEIRKADLHSFVNSLRDKNKDLKPETVNRYLSHVATMFSAAPSYFRELEREDWQPPHFPWERVSKRGRERTITREERDTLLQALRFSGPQEYRGRRDKPDIIATRRDVADCFEVGLHTAMRPGEVRTLTWAQINFDAAEIHLGKNTKTGEPGDIPMNRRVMEIFRRRHKSKSSRWVFPNPAGTGPRGEISRVLRPLAKRLGMEYGRDLEDGFTPHSTRHTATTEMLRRGHDLATVKSVTRHSDTTMALRYAHATHASRRSAVEDLAGKAQPGNEQPENNSESGLNSFEKSPESGQDLDDLPISILISEV